MTRVERATPTIGDRCVSAGTGHWQEEPITIFTHICRSCRSTLAVSQAEIEAARRELEQFADDEAQLAELLAAGDHAIAAEFEFCPACRALEPIADVERDDALGDLPDTSGPYDRAARLGVLPRAACLS